VRATKTKVRVPTTKVRHELHVLKKRNGRKQPWISFNLIGLSLQFLIPIDALFGPNAYVTLCLFIVAILGTGFRTLFFLVSIRIFWKLPKIAQQDDPGVASFAVKELVSFLSRSVPFRLSLILTMLEHMHIRVNI
jgi:hypothetical protein